MSASATTATTPSRAHMRWRSAREFWRKFSKRRPGVAGVIVLIVFSILAIAPALFVGPLQTVTTAPGAHLEPPSLEFPMGTDALGRSVLNLTVWGTRISMVIGLLATIITVVLGALVGIVSGFVGGRTDQVLMRITDLFLVLPTFVLALVLAPIILEIVGRDAEVAGIRVTLVVIVIVIGITSGFFGGRVDAFLMRITDFFLVLPTFVLALVLAPIILDIVGENSQVAGIRMTLVVIVIVIGITSWASTARIIRSQALSVKERMFVDRARVIGSGGGHIMRRHILPNVLNLLVANTVLVFGGAILTETLLAFVGLGDPFAPSWGQILNSAEAQGAPTLGAWWYIVPPATCIVLVVLSFTLVGGALDSVLNPRLRRRR